MRTITPRSARQRAHSVAIDLGSASLRVAEMEWHSDGGTPVIVRRSAAALPPEVWNDLTNNRNLIADTIKSTLATAGITAKNVVACLPRRLVTLRFIKLPHAEPEMLRGLVTYEAQQYVMFPLEEVILDYMVVGDPQDSDEGEMQTVLLAAARRSLIAEVMAIFDLAGLELEQLSISALALAENLRDAQEPTAIVDLEPGELEVSVVGDRQLLFTRASSIMLDGLDMDVAARKLAEELSRSFLAVQNEMHGRPLSHIYLAGASTGPLDAPTVERILSEVLDTPIERWHSPLFQGTTRGDHAFITAAGLALQTDGKGIAPINLVPDERAERRRVAALVRQRILVTATVLVVVLGAALYSFKTISDQTKLRKETQLANNALTDADARLKIQQKQWDARNALDTELTNGLNRKQPVVDVLMAISRCLPKQSSVWLTQTTFERGGALTLRGETKSALAATDLVMTLQRTGSFKDVQITYLGDAQESGSGNSAVPRTRVTSTSAPGGAPVTGLPAMPQQPGGPPPGMGAMPGGMPPGMPGGMPGGVPPGMPGGMPPGMGAPPAGVQIPPPASAPTANLMPSNGTPSASGGRTITRSSGGAGLTSFIITCKLNSGASSLIPSANLIPVSTKEEKHEVKRTTRSVNVLRQSQPDAGDDDED